MPSLLSGDKTTRSMPLALEKCVGPLPRVARGYSTKLEVSPCGRLLVYCNRRSVFLQPLEKSQPARIYSEHPVATSVARFSPDGTLIASGDESGNVRIWHVSDFKCRFERKMMAGKVSDIAWCADNKRICVVGQGAASINFETDSSLGCLSGHTKTVNTVAVKPNSAGPQMTVLTGADDFSVFLFDGKPLRFKRDLNAHSSFVHQIKFSPSGNRAVSVGADHSVVVYQDEQLSASNCDLHQGTIYGCSWVSEDRFLTVGADRRVCLSEYREKSREIALISSLKVFDDQLLGVSFSSLFSDAYCVSLAGTLYQVHVAGDHLDVRGETFGALSGICAFDVWHCIGQDQELLAADVLGTVAKFPQFTDPLESNLLLVTGKERHSPPTSRLLGYAGEVLSIFGYRDYILVLLHSEDLVIYRNLEVQLKIPHVTALTGVSTGYVFYAQNGHIKKLRVSTHTEVASIEAGPVRVLTADHRYVIAIGEKSNLVTVLSGDSLQSLWSFNCKFNVTCAAISKSSSLVALGTKERYLQVVAPPKASGDSPTLLVDKQWAAHSSSITSIVWSAHENSLYSAGLDGCIGIWDVESITSYHLTRAAHIGPIFCLAICNGRLVSGGDDGCVRRWVLSE